MLNEWGSRLGKIALVMLVMAMGTGCLRLTQDIKKPGGEVVVILRQEARGLAGAKLRDLVVEAKDPVSDVPLTTGLIRHVADRSKDAVVSIYVRTRTPYRLTVLPFSPLGGIPLTVPGIGLGSGFFIHPSGYILSNNHVIEDAEQIKIQTSGGKEYDVLVIARDPVYDLALLKIKNPPAQPFPVLPMGDSNLAAAGDMVIAVGNPLGLGHTVTAGIISQTGRNLTGVPQNKERHIEYIQTDTSINPGSSGGPLIALSGNWVAVNTAGMTQAQGIGFSVPSAQVRKFLERILAGKGELEEK